MPRTSGKNLSFNTCPGKSEIAQHIEKFMTSRLVFETKFGIIQNPACSDMRSLRNLQFFLQAQELIVCHFLINDNDCIIKISALNQSLVDKRLNFRKETESTCRSKVADKLLFQSKEPGMLTSECRIIIIHHNCNAIII